MDEEGYDFSSDSSSSSSKKWNHNTSSSIVPESAESRKVWVDVDGVGVAGEAVEGGLVGGRLHGSEGLLGSDWNSALTLTEVKDML